MTVGWIGGSIGATGWRPAGAPAPSDADAEARRAQAQAAPSVPAATALEQKRAVDPAAAARALGLYADGSGASAERIFAALADDEAIEAEIERQTAAAAEPARDEDGAVGLALRALFGAERALFGAEPATPRDDAEAPRDDAEAARERAAQTLFLQSLGAVRGER